MLTKIGRYLNISNGSEAVIPLLSSDSKGVYPWRTINSDTEQYYGSYVRSHSLSTLVSTIGNTGASGIALGSGTTPATEDDYTMESLISSGISCAFASKAFAYDSENDVPYTYINITVTNTGSEPVTISELGIFVAVRASSTKGDSVSTSNDWTVMIDHTILENPVTIAANEAGIIQYRFEADLDEE